MMQLHFTKDVLPNSVSGDFQNLNKFNEQQFLRLMEILFQFLLNPKETEKLMEQLSDFAGAMKRNLTAEQLKEDLQTLGLHEDKAAHFSQQWAEHRTKLCRLAVQQTLTVNRLVDMEWKFGVTVGTSEIHKMSNIFLQLKLVVQKGSSTENLYMELSLPQFYNFLREMERAKASMDSFS
ncbi:COMM domain-containing protein 7 isoform X2 [Syngnathoides biaculeatus]|uniref:COMM domain-containing protein 7 isoform X2 n=1 Tax=Syngnathoides biaculeatus TaxID=300417 RepID=UPI002ADE607E|nr:COMM domain-containing protein 7 isoform X2 [Syngnathoides biaculeatus]